MRRSHGNSLNFSLATSWIKMLLAKKGKMKEEPVGVGKEENFSWPRDGSHQTLPWKRPVGSLTLCWEDRDVLLGATSGALRLTGPMSLCLFVLSLLCLGSHWLLYWCTLTKACFPGVSHLPRWGFPADADLPSACVKQLGSEEESTPHGENLWPRGNGSQWITSSLFLSLEPVLNAFTHVACQKMVLGEGATGHAWFQAEASSIMHPCSGFPPFPASLSFPRRPSRSYQPW